MLLCWREAALNGLRCVGQATTKVYSSNTGQWMMVPMSMVSPDGSQCNMIGTSYYAFKYAQVVRMFPQEGSVSERQWGYGQCASLSPTAHAHNLQGKVCVPQPHAGWILLRQGGLTSRVANRRVQVRYQAAAVNAVAVFPAGQQLPPEPVDRPVRRRHDAQHAGHHADLLCQPLGRRPGRCHAGPQACFQPQTPTLGLTHPLMILQQLHMQHAIVAPTYVWVS